MKIEGTDFIETYKRPCLAVCKKCKSHGIIIFDDDSYSDEIRSITYGEELIKKLTEQKVLDPENAQRISDQLACSEIPLYVKDFDIEDGPITAGLIAGLVIATLRPLHDAQKSRVGDGSDSDMQSFPA